MELQINQFWIFQANSTVNSANEYEPDALIEDITRWREDMNFMFEWQEQHLTSERSERVRYWSCHENTKFISSSQRVMFFLLYKYTDNGVFDDFPKISEDFSKLSRRTDERSQTLSENFRKLPKMSEDFRRLPKTFKEDPKMFRWYTNEFMYNLWDKLDITEIIDIFTCEDIVSFFSICYHSIYHWLLYNKILFVKHGFKNWTFY